MKKRRVGKIREAPDHDARFLQKMRVLEGAIESESAELEPGCVAFPQLSAEDQAALIERLEDEFANRMANPNDPQSRLCIYESGGAVKGKDFATLFPWDTPIHDWVHTMQYEALKGLLQQSTASREWLTHHMKELLVLLVSLWNSTHDQFRMKAGDGVLILNV